MGVEVLSSDLAGPSDPAIVAAAESLIPRLRERAPEAERLGHLPDETITDLENLGLLRLMEPRRYGGTQASLRTVSDVAVALARGCGSTSWVFCLYASVPCLVGRLPAAAMEDFYAASNKLAVTSFGRAENVVERAPGGYVLKKGGLWPFTSGQHHAGWVLALGGVSQEGEAPEGRLFLIPRSSFTALDDWHVSGMAGTSSNTLMLKEDEFVPEHRSQLMTQTVTGQGVSDPYYRTAHRAATLIAGGCALGMAQGAVDLFRERVHSRTITYTSYASQAQSPYVQVQMAEASLLFDEAEFHLNRALAEGVKSADARDMVSKVRSGMDLARTFELSRQVIDIIQQMSGARAVQLKDPIQRWMRDICTISVHARSLASTNKEIYGQVLFGMPPDPAMFPS